MAVRLKLATMLILTVLPLHGCAGGGYQGVARERWDAQQLLESQAESLASRGQTDAAADILIELWGLGAVPVPPEGSLGTYFIALDIGRIVRQAPQLSPRFQALEPPLLDRILAQSATQHEFDSWRDLCHTLGDDGAIVEFMSAAQQQPPLQDYLHVGHFPRLNEDPVFQATIRKERWDLAGLVYKDPLSSMKDDLCREGFMLSPIGLGIVAVVAPMVAPRLSSSFYGDLFDPSTHARARQKSREYKAKEAAQRYAACLAAGRDKDADRLAAFAARMVPRAAARAECVRQAVRAGQVRRQHLDWFERDPKLAVTEPALLERVRSMLPTEQPKR